MKVAVMVLASLWLVFLSTSNSVLEGPQLYVYTDRSVYAPDSTVLVRVLAIDENGLPAVSRMVFVLVYPPGANFPEVYEGVTGEDGYLLLEINVTLDGVYLVTAEDAEFEFGTGETTFLVCSSCLVDSETRTVTHTIVSTETSTITQDFTTTLTASVTLTETLENTITSTATVTRTGTVEKTRTEVRFFTTTLREIVSKSHFITVTMTYLDTVTSTQIPDLKDYYLSTTLAIVFCLILLLATVYTTFRRRTL